MVFSGARILPGSGRILVSMFSELLQLFINGFLGFRVLGFYGFMGLGFFPVQEFCLGLAVFFCIYVFRTVGAIH